MKRVLSLILVLCLVLGLSISTTAASYTYNSGTRHEVATELSSQAIAYYSDNYSWENLSSLEGGSGNCLDLNNELFQTLHELMSSTHTSYVTYKNLPNYWVYTDTDAQSNSYIWFYADSTASGTMSREHVWPKSHASFYESGGGSDLHHLRPSISNINSSRGNLIMGNVKGNSGASAYTWNGEVVLYTTSTMCEVNDNIKGDVARIFLYVWCRWEEPNLFMNDPDPTIVSSDNDGGKVIESLETLLQWCEMDPVDTWEMSRNDQIQNIQGNRNVFIDYPELAWLLFGEEIPTDMVTPSGMAANGSTGSTSCSHTNTDMDNKCDKCNEPVDCLHGKSELDASTVKTATCKSTGYTGDYVCIYCGIVTTEGSSEDKLPHPNENKDTRCDECNAVLDCEHGKRQLDSATVQKVTCTKNGYTGDEVCVYCGEVTKPGTVITLLEHLNDDNDNVCERCGETLDQEECGHGRRETDKNTAKEATCSKEGYAGDICCFYCGKKLDNGASIPKTAHVNEDKDNICDECGADLEDCGHGKTIQKVIQSPTCTEYGCEGTFCFFCGDLQPPVQQINPLGHNMSTADCEHASTCQREGCSYTEGTAAGHQWNEADCENAKTCSVCHKTEGDPLGHDWKNADCETPRTCTRCGKTVGYALGHDLTEADCVHDSVCQREGCGHIEQKALGHKLTATSAKAASCKEGGNKAYYTCDVCQSVYSDKYGINETTIDEMTIPATGHTDKNKDLHCDECDTNICATHNWTPATCTDPETCSECGETQGRNLGHTWGDPDCETPATCSVCRSTKGKALGHDWKSATCTSPATCTLCNSTKGTATGHTFGQWEGGTRSCTVCGHQETEDQSDCPHEETILRNDVPATCGATGYTGDHYCADCGAKTFTGSTILATGEHRFDEWITSEDLSSRTCEVCGYVETVSNTEPSDPTQPSDPTDPSETEPSETQPTETGPSTPPTETEPSPTVPAETTPDPTEPQNPTDPGDPSNPTDPSDPSDPTDPSETEPSPTVPAETTPDPTEPEPASSFPILPVLIIPLLLVIGAIVFLILKMKKSQ